MKTTMPAAALRAATKAAVKKMWARKAWAAVITFLCGAALVASLKPAAKRGAEAAPGPRWVTPAPPLVLGAPPLDVDAPCPPAAAEFADDSDWGHSPAGQRWKERNNGRSLGLDYGGLSAGELAEAKVEPFASGGVLAAAGGTLYLLDAAGQKVWERGGLYTIFDFAHVPATGLVYVTAIDNNLFILDARTGRELHRESRNGRAGFGRAVAYGKDLCLVADDNSGYRSPGDSTPPMGDGVTAWRGTKMLWHRELPPDAELRVSGDRIFAVTKTRSRILFQEIHAPPAGR